MSTRSAEANGRQRVSDLYLDYVEADLVPHDSARLVVETWPGGWTTLGVVDAHNERAPLAITAAAMGALATQSAAGRHFESWAHPNTGIFARSRMYAGLLHSLNRAAPNAGQGLGMYLATNFYRADTPALRNNTVDHSTLRGVFHDGITPNALQTHVLRENDQLHLGETYSRGRIRQLSADAVRHGLSRDYDLTSEDNDFLTMHARWAIIQRLGPRLDSIPLAAEVHYGQFVNACTVIRSRLDPHQRLQDYIDPRCYATYRHATERLGILGLQARETIGTVPHPLPHVTRDDSYLQEFISNNKGSRPRLHLRPMSNIPVFDERTTTMRPDSYHDVMRSLESGADISALDALRLGVAGVHQQLAECRKVGNRRRTREARRRVVRNTLEEQVYPQYPYLHPGTATAIGQADRLALDRMSTPGHASTELQSILANRRDQVTNLQVAGILAGALLGNATVQREAYNTLSDELRTRLARDIYRLMPYIQNQRLDDIPSLGESYNLSAAEVADLAISTANIDSDLPVCLYIHGALALLDNSNSLFASKMAMGRVKLGRTQNPTRERRLTENAIDNIRSIVLSEAEQRYGVTIPQARQRADIRARAADETAAMFIFCRLAELLAVTVSQSIAAENIIALRFGPILAKLRPEILPADTPPIVEQTHTHYLERYRQLSAPSNTPLWQSFLRQVRN